MFKKLIAWIVIYGMTFSPALATAQIVADQAAPGNQQPQVFPTAGGVPQVNINTPNKSGLSHNKYQQFDVDKRGVVLNNSTKNVQTQLGGWVEGNPNLAGGSAKTILNEVNSSQPSKLKGFVEVGGQKADVIIANPSGIQVDGGGFINAGRATLTTGKPQISGGQVTGYRVEGGRIEINGQGLDGSGSDYTAIISQSVAVNAGIWAKDLTITTGRNTVSADGSAATALDPSAGEIQGVALDVSALGGMYAGSIKLIGTDKGLGVRNTGDIVAQVGEVVITQDGRLENSGTISGKMAARITSKSEVKNTGRLQSGGTVAVRAKSVKNHKEIVASKRVEIKADEDVVNTDSIQAGEEMSLDSATLDNQGKILSGGTSAIAAATKLDNTGSIEATELSITAGEFVNQAGAEVLAEKSLTEVTTLRNTGLFDGGEVVIKAGTLENIRTGTILGDHLALQGDNILNGLPLGEDGIGTSGLIGARNRLDIGAGTLTNREDGLIYSAGDIHIGGALDTLYQAVGRATEVVNSSAVMDATGSLYATVVDFFNRNAHYRTELRVVRDWNWQGYRFKEDSQGRIFIQGIDGYFGGGTYDQAAGYAEGDYGGTPIFREEKFFIYRVHRVEKDTFVIESRPGFIYTGGDFVVDGNLTNDHSRIIVGGNIVAAPSGPFAVNGTFTNIAALEPYIITDSGSYRWSHLVWNWSGTSKDREEDDPIPYNPPDDITYNEKDVVLNNNYPAPSSVPGQSVLAGLNQNLYTINPACTSGYLIESNPRLTNYRTWLSSDFMLDRMNTSPTVVHKRLGDGFYEQRLVREQIANLTGLRFLGGFDNDEDQYMALMLAGVEFAEKYQISPGVTLSAAQMALMTTDIVWLEEITVETANGPVKVLAPKVYLAPGRENMMTPGGTVVSAKNILMELGGGFQNSGTLYAAKTLDVSAENIDNEGTLSGGRVYLTAAKDINNIGGSIIGEDLVSLVAANDINIASSTQTTTRSGANYSGSRTQLDRLAMVSVKNENGLLLVDAGRDINLKAAVVASAGDAALMAGRNLNISTVETSYEYRASHDSKNSGHTKDMVEVGSSVSAAGDLDMAAGYDLNVRGSDVYAEGALTGEAGRDINIVEGRAQHEHEDKIYSQSSRPLGSKSTAIYEHHGSDQAIGSSLSGDTISLAAKQGVTVRGSDVAASNGLDVYAARDINVSGAENTSFDESKTVTKRSGLTGGVSGGRVSVGYGKSEDGRESSSQNLWHSASLLGSENGPVNIYAGQDVTVSGSQVVAGTGDVAISGREVTIENQYDTYDTKSRQWSKQSGVTLSVGLGGAAGQVVDKGVEASRMLGNAKNAHTGNAATLYGISGVRNAYEAAQGVKGLLSGGGGIGVGVSLGFSKSESESQSQTHDQVAAGSSITSGGDTFIVARGEEGNDHSGDLNIIGSHVNAGGTVTLAANNNLNLLSAEERSTYQHSNKSSGSGFGVGYEFGTGGAGLSVNGYANQSKGQGNGASVTHAETVVSGTEGVTFISAGDTTLKGAEIFGGQVTGRVSGDLTIISEQETNTDRLSQKSSGGGFSAGGSLADTSLNYNQQKQNAKGDYASVNEQSGIWAGQGGFDIEVGGHTGLTGAVIASEADAAKNSLTTATLSTEDIQNKSSYSAETKGWGVEISGDKGSISPSLPMEEDGKDHSTTKSAIAPGTVTITDEAAQKARTGQDAATTIANLNRDTDNAHQGPLAHNPDLQDLLDKQAELADAAAQAGKAVAKTVGDISQHMTREVDTAQMAKTAAELKLQDSNLSAEERAIYQAQLDAANAILNDPTKIAEAEKWQDGGIYKTLMHAAGAALVAQLGNGEGLNAALGAAASQLAAGKIDEFARGVAGQMTTDPTAQSLIANLLTSAASGGLGYAAGGGTGATAASTIDANNRQLHPDEIKWIKDHADEFAQVMCDLGQCLSKTEAQALLAQQALRKVDAWWEAALAPTTSQLADQQYLEKLAAANAYLDQASTRNFIATPNPIHEKQQQGYFTAVGGQFDDATSMAEYYRGAAGQANLAFYREAVHPYVDHSEQLYTKVIDYYALKVSNTLKIIVQDPTIITTGLGGFLGETAFDLKSDPLGTLEGYSYSFTSWLGDKGRSATYQVSPDTRAILNAIYNDGSAAELQTQLVSIKLGSIVVSGGVGKAATWATKTAYEKIYTSVAAKLSGKAAAAAEGAFKDALKSVLDDWSKAGLAMDPADKSGLLTASGRALQKHGGREGSAFPKPTGNPNSINAQGQKILDDILNAPGTISTSKSIPRYGNIIDVVAPDGRGARFSSDGRLIGFLEPPKK